MMGGEMMIWFIIGLLIAVMLDSICNIVKTICATHNETKVLVERERTEQERLKYETAKILAGKPNTNRSVSD